uniref:Uncharacterized protein n=1 Tax=Leersia perrieri TaxID=77586 RepID=A0A0D9XNX1_9ORYZ
MERSSPKLVIARVLLVVFLVSHLEVATAQYGGSSSNGAAGPMAAGGGCSVAVAAAVLAIAAFVWN